MTTRPTASTIDDIAADWAARLDAHANGSGDLAPEDQAELDAWLASDVRCFGAFARARALAVSPDIAEAFITKPPLRLLPPQSVSRRAFMAAMAAGIAGAGVWVFRGRERISTLAYASLLGEIRDIPLPDGSHVTLNTDSAITVEFAKGRRLVRLLRGEAYFQVAKNPDRPFIVMGPMAQVRTVGTSYTVRLVEPGTMKVQVTSGRVALESPPAKLTQSLQSAGLWPVTSNTSHDAVFVDPNQEALIRLTQSSGLASDLGGGEIDISVRAVAADTLARGLMWRDGRLSFEGSTLAQACAEFARYSPRRITIADNSLAHMHISGLFHANDPDGFARAVALSLRASVKSDDRSIILYR